MSRFTLLVAPLLCVFLGSCSSDPELPIAMPVDTKYVSRGRALVKGLAACGYCHGESADPSSKLTGGRTMRDKYGEVNAANITPTADGVGTWSPNDLAAGIRSAKRPDGEYFSPDVHVGYAWMSDPDVYSIVTYLKSIPPVEHQVDRRSIGFMDRNTTGLFDSAKEITGYVPDLDPREKVAYGKYLVDHVARCGYCHDTPGGFFSDAKYLNGGGGELEATGAIPNITGNKVYGIGAWTEVDIVKYLKTGETPENSLVNTEACPIEFYKNAKEDDLTAIAAYLKTVTEG